MELGRCHPKAPATGWTQPEPHRQRQAPATLRNAEPDDRLDIVPNGSSEKTPSRSGRGGHTRGSLFSELTAAFPQRRAAQVLAGGPIAESGPWSPKPFTERLPPKGFLDAPFWIILFTLDYMMTM